jgi:hypothetical protein
MKLSGHHRGKVLFPSDFAELGSEDAIHQALSRLTKKGILLRLGKGVYLYPRVDPELGILVPSVEEIAAAIAKRDKVKIMPSGVYALHKLGLTTQVPTKAVYLTDGTPREIRVGKRTIAFKKTTPQKLKVKGVMNQLVIQALSELGEKAVNGEVLKKIYSALDKEDPTLIRKDSFLTAVWISKIMNEYLKSRGYEKLD